MNVTKYMTHRKAPVPKIEKEEFMKDFKHPSKYSVSEKHNALPYTTTKEKAQPYSIKNGEKVYLSEFKSGGKSYHYSKSADSHWKRFGISDRPIKVIVDNEKLYNPNNLSNKEMAVARWQGEVGTANGFNQRLESIETGKSLPEIKEEESKYQGGLRALDADYNSSLQKMREALNTKFETSRDFVKGSAMAEKDKEETISKLYKKKESSISKSTAKKGAELNDTKASLQKGRIRPKIVVSPAVAEANLATMGAVHHDAAANIESAKLAAEKVSLAKAKLSEKLKAKKDREDAELKRDIAAFKESQAQSKKMAAEAKKRADEAKVAHGDYSGLPGVNNLVEIGKILNKTGLQTYDFSVLEELFKDEGIAITGKMNKTNLTNIYKNYKKSVGKRK